MALSPIALFQSNDNSLAQILAGGNQTVSGIMDRAIQIGRDISNKQLSQEKDLSAMRIQQQAFDQRRAETAQQDYEDTRRFARGAFEADRNYGLQERQEARAGVRDLFNMQTEQQRIGIAREGLGLSKSRFELEKSEEERKRAEVEAERARVNSLLTAAPAAETAPATPAAPLTKASSDDAYAAELDRRTAAGELGVRPEVPFERSAGAATTTTAAPKMSRKQADDRLVDLESVLSSPAASITDKTAAKKEILDIQRLFPDSGVKEETPAGRRSARSLEIREETLARQKAEDEAKLLVGDTKAFTPQVPQVYREGATKKDLEEAQAYDKDRFVSEVNSAQNYTEEKYVNFPGMTLTASQKAKRRKLWQYANGIAGGSTTPSTGGSSPVRDLGL
jgi:hypothetical protein